MSTSLCTYQDNWPASHTLSINIDYLPYLVHLLSWKFSGYPIHPLKPQKLSWITKSSLPERMDGRINGGTDAYLFSFWVIPLAFAEIDHYPALGLAPYTQPWQEAATLSAFERSTTPFGRLIFTGRILNIDIKGRRVGGGDIIELLMTLASLMVSFRSNTFAPNAVLSTWNRDMNSSPCWGSRVWWSRSIATVGCGWSPRTSLEWASPSASGLSAAESGSFSLGNLTRATAGPHNVEFLGASR